LSEPVDAAALTYPVPQLHLIRIAVFGKSGRLGLLGGEEALLVPSEFDEPPPGLAVGSNHDKIRQLS